MSRGLGGGCLVKLVGVLQDLVIRIFFLSYRDSVSLDSGAVKRAS